MATVKLVEETAAAARVKAIYDDIKATKKIERVPNFWRALAANPDNLERCRNQAKAIMKPGKLDLLTKEIIALAVSITNSCRYCINSHTAACQKLGMTPEQYGEFLAVAGLYNQFNKMADAFQVDPDILPLT
ncbi:MAG TPA: carboxymuconolactone decarboxylase family protein [Gemmataceae bacterium]|jgi:AhpD family alkylhydroperoxidase|nr:carboxymuconolactone decarboxylase family protein [Gemmataceae bacterium]